MQAPAPDSTRASVSTFQWISPRTIPTQTIHRPNSTRAKSQEHAAIAPNLKDPAIYVVLAKFSVTYPIPRDHVSFATAREGIARLSGTRIKSRETAAFGETSMPHTLLM